VAVRSRGAGGAGAAEGRVIVLPGLGLHLDRGLTGGLRTSLAEAGFTALGHASGIANPATAQLRSGRAFEISCGGASAGATLLQQVGICC
jgi:hypothetical protein